MSSLIKTSQHLKEIDETDDIKRLMQIAVEFLSVHADSARIVAAAVGKMKKLGYIVELEEIPSVKWYEQIHEGRLSPELFAAFCGKPKLLEKTSTFTIEQQERLAKNTPIKVVVLNPDGTRTHKMCPPLTMGNDTIKQVFDYGAIRNEAEQREYLDCRIKKAAERNSGATSSALERPRYIVHRNKKQIEVPTGAIFNAFDVAAMYEAICKPKKKSKDLAPASAR